MCESCGPNDPDPVDPELLERFRENLARRGITAKAISDPDCYGTPFQKMRERTGRLVFNLRILAGWV
jgi:hypothetical protein